MVREVDEVLKHFQETLGTIPEPLKPLGEFAPEVLTGYYQMRKWLMREPPEGALPKKVKELIYVALDCVLGAPVPFLKAHSREAIKAGATAREVSEAVTLVLMLGGMPKYMTHGYEALKAAIEAEKELKKG